MANLHITEFSGLANAGLGGGSIPCASGDAITAFQAVVTSAGSTQSAAFQTGSPGNGVNGNESAATPPTRFIGVVAGANCSIAFGANPTAAAGDFYIASSQPMQIIAVTPGEKLAVINDTP